MLSGILANWLAFLTADPVIIGWIGPVGGVVMFVFGSLMIGVGTLINTTSSLLKQSYKIGEELSSLAIRRTLVQDGEQSGYEATSTVESAEIPVTTAPQG
jgi:hypothetical protein